MFPFCYIWAVVQQAQRFWAIGLMGKWFCIWDDLLRLFAIARVANPKNRA